MNRRTAEWIQEAGFRLEERHDFKTGLIPLLAPHVLGEAVPV